MATVSAAEHRRCLSSIKLHCVVVEVRECEGLAQSYYEVHKKSITRRGLVEISVKVKGNTVEKDVIHVYSKQDNSTRHKCGVFLTNSVKSPNIMAIVPLKVI